jgi:hypothetical protein
MEAQGEEGKHAFGTRIGPVKGVGPGERAEPPPPSPFHRAPVVGPPFPADLPGVPRPLPPPPRPSPVPTLPDPAPPPPPGSPDRDVALDAGVDTAPPPPPEGPAAWYAVRESEARQAEEALEARMRTIATWRLLAFLGLLAPLLALETSPLELRPVLVGIAALVAVAFVLLVLRHRKLRRRRDRETLRGVVSREGLARLERRWDGLPLLPLPAPPEGHPYAADLDVAGRASLAHLLGTPRTIPGRSRLREALLDPLAGDPEEARTLREARRASVEVLARRPELLERVQVAARSVERPGDPDGLARFRAWASGPGWSPPGGWGRGSSGPGSSPP